MDLTRRAARAQDKELVRGWHRASMGPHVTATWGWDDELQRSYFESRFDPERLEIVEQNGVPVGYLALRQESDRFILDELVLAPEHHNRGLGSRVMEEILSLADERGLAVELRVLRVNPARRLYERLGFELLDSSDTHHRMRRPAPSAG